MKVYQKIPLKIGFIIIFAFGTVITKAQSNFIKTVFRLLPSGCLYELSDATRDSMLEGKTYYPVENDSTSILAFNYGESGFVEDYLYVSMAYETSQRGSGMVEIRAFKMKQKDLIVVSRTGGVEGINYQQIEISTFIYDGDRNLVLNKDKIFPDWSVDLFVKPGVPDAIKKEISNNINLVFDFSYPDVLLQLKSPFLLENSAYREWLKGDCLKYEWTGKKFEPKQISFSN